MEIRIFPLGPLQVNCYLLLGEKEAVVIDPGGPPDPAMRALETRYPEAGGKALAHILNTHLHFDHTGGNLALQRATGAPSLASPLDAWMLDTELGQGGFMGLPRIELFPFQPLEPGETVFAGQPCRVLATPGHTPGSLSFHFPAQGVVFVGDLLFRRSVGRTDFPQGDFATLARSIREQIFTLPPATRILSGHGEETSVAEEMAHNPYVAEFSQPEGGDLA